jgi:hypothetical protein
MVEASCNSRHSALEPDDVDWHQALAGGVVSKLCIGILAPALDAASIGERASMISTSRNRRDSGRQPDDIDGR